MSLGDNMAYYIEKEAVALAKCLARSLTCSGNRARKARQTADELLKWQLQRVCTDNFSGITEDPIGLGNRPPAKYVLYLAFIAARLCDCLSFYRLKAPAQDIGKLKIVTFIGKGDNPARASHLFWEIWKRLVNERRCFVSLNYGFNKRIDKYSKKRRGDEFALWQVNRLWKQVEMFIPNNEVTTAHIQEYVKAYYCFIVVPKFEFTEETQGQREARE